MKKQIGKYLIITAFMTIYCYIIIYTVKIIFPAIFPLLLGFLLYFLFAHKNAFHFIHFLKSVALAIGWLTVSFILWILAIMKLCTIWIKNNTFMPYIHKNEAIDNFEQTELSFYIVSLLCCIIPGVIIYLISKLKFMKNLKEKS